MLYIRLLGAFQLTYNGQPYTAVQSVCLQAMLAYLALRAGTAQTRRHLAFLFWPDSTEEQAHTNLRKLLHSLRQCLISGPFGEETQGQISVNTVFHESAYMSHVVLPVYDWV